MSDREIQILSPPDKVKNVLADQAEKLVAVLPKHLTPEKFIQVVSTLVFKTPRLQECKLNTIVSSVFEACELGLELSQKMGEAYLIPRWNGKHKIMECQLQIGFQGLRKLALQSGQVSFIRTALVYERDIFEYEYDPELIFRHKPFIGRDKGDMIYVYSMARLKDVDEPVLEVMDLDEIESIHRRSQTFQDAAKYDKAESGPWATDYGEMARKTVLKRHCKSLPRSLELARAIEIDDGEYRDSEPVVVSANPRQRFATRSEDLADRLSGRSRTALDEPAFTEGTSGQVHSEDDFDGDVGHHVDDSPSPPLPTESPAQDNATSPPVRRSGRAAAPKPEGQSDLPLEPGSRG